MKPFDYGSAIGAHIADHDIQPGSMVDININGYYVATVLVIAPVNEKVQFKVIAQKNIFK